MKNYDQFYKKKEGPVMVTKKNDNGSVVILSIAQVNIETKKGEDEK